MNKCDIALERYSVMTKYRMMYVRITIPANFWWNLLPKHTYHLLLTIVNYNSYSQHLDVLFTVQQPRNISNALAGACFWVPFCLCEATPPLALTTAQCAKRFVSYSHLHQIVIIVCYQSFFTNSVSVDKMRCNKNLPINWSPYLCPTWWYKLQLCVSL